MAERYAYIGVAEMWYQDYLDLDTGRMLTAVPGESYSMSPVNSPDQPVPPNDGRWQSDAPVPPAPPVDPPVIPAPAPAAPQGGES